MCVFYFAIFSRFTEPSFMVFFFLICWKKYNRIDIAGRPKRCKNSVVTSLT